jgi:hypothetical protein
LRRRVGVDWGCLSLFIFAGILLGRCIHVDVIYRDTIVVYAIFVYHEAGHDFLVQCRASGFDDLLVSLGQ